MSKHPSHTTQLGKINRAIGQLEAIKRMIEEERYCIDIMSQLRAARNAIKGVELGVLETHMGNCLSDACCAKNDKARDVKIAELISLLKKYE